MTQREKAICEVFTGICFCAGEQRKAVYEYASELLGRPIYTHEFLSLAEELKEKSRADFVAVCKNTTEPDIVKRLVKERDYWKEEAEEARADLQQSSAEAIRTFAERLKKEAYREFCDNRGFDKGIPWVMEDVIDAVAKELTEDPSNDRQR